MTPHGLLAVALVREEGAWAPACSPGTADRLCASCSSYSCIPPCSNESTASLLPPARHSVLSQRVRHCWGKRELWAWASSCQRRSSAHTPLHGDCSDHQAKKVGPPLLQALLCLQGSFCEEMGYHRALAITQRPWQTGRFRAFRLKSNFRGPKLDLEVNSAQNFSGLSGLRHYLGRSTRHQS